MRKIFRITGIVLYEILALLAGPGGAIIYGILLWNHILPF